MPTCASCRHTLVHGVTSQHRPGFRHESRGIPWCGYRRSNAVTSRHRHFNCPWRLNTVVDTKHYVSHCIDIVICILFQPNRFVKNSFVYCFSFLLKCFYGKEINIHERGTMWCIKNKCAIKENKVRIFLQWLISSTVYIRNKN